jgi:hypothetical protein
VRRRAGFTPTSYATGRYRRTAQRPDAGVKRVDAQFTGILPAMAGPPDDDPSPPAPDPEKLRELLGRMLRRDRSLTLEEVREVRKWLRLNGGLKSPGSQWTWPKPEPFPYDPPGSDVPLRDDPK